MYKVVYSPQASTDLLFLVFYIAYSLDNPIAAKRLGDKISKKIEGLSIYPNRFIELKLGTHVYHRMPVGKYNVYYVVDEKQKTVTVVDIWYGGKNIDEVAITMN